MDHMQKEVKIDMRHHAVNGTRNNLSTFALIYFMLLFVSQQVTHSQ